VTDEELTTHTKESAMKVELKNVRIASNLSRETIAY
jgi:hypothetical protein